MARQPIKLKIVENLVGIERTTTAMKSCIIFHNDGFVLLFVIPVFVSWCRCKGQNHTESQVRCLGPLTLASYYRQANVLALELLPACNARPVCFFFISFPLWTRKINRKWMRHIGSFLQPTFCSM